MTKHFDIDVIKAIPIVNVAKSLGIVVLKNNKAMCFAGHDKKTPSLSFNFEKNYWHCFGCGIGGDNIKLVMDVNNISFKQAIVWFQENYFQTNNVSCISKSQKYRGRSQEKIRANNIQKEKFYTADPDVYDWIICSSSLSNNSRTYLINRGLNDDTIERFRIRDLTKPDRFFHTLKERWGLKRLQKCGILSLRSKLLVPPWWDYSLWFPFIGGNRIEYLQRRRFASTGPKYVNLSGLSKPIFNIDKINKLEPFDKVYICEGVPDTIIANQIGWSAIGVLGATSIDTGLVEKLMPYSIVVIPDNDFAGAQLYSKLYDKFLKKGKIIHRIDLNVANDFSDFVRKKLGR